MSSKKNHRPLLSQRGRERQQRLFRQLDLTCAALGISIVLAVLCTMGQPYELGQSASTGPALWFLLILAYVPLELIGLLNWCFGWQNTALMHYLVNEHQALAMGGFDLAMTAAVWALIRFWAGRRYGMEVLKTSMHFLTILTAWGYFQLFCVVAVNVWSNGGFTPLHRHLQRPDEPEKVMIVTSPDSTITPSTN